MPDERPRPSGTMLAFDFGHRRIGVAVGQTLTGTANALAVVSVSGKPDWQTITGIITEWKPAALVVGLPLAADGGDTEMSIHNAPVRVETEAHLKDISALGIHAIKPVAVVEVTVALCRLRDRRSGLVDTVIVKICNHIREIPRFNERQR